MNSDRQRIQSLVARWPMKNSLFCLVFLIFGSFAGAAPRSEPGIYKILVSREILKNSQLPFFSHHDPGPYGKALAMNISYEPVKQVRMAIESKLGHKLKIFTGWDPQGEAHITTITPPEFTNIFSSYVSIQEIDEIAVANTIQSSDLQIDGIGRGVSIIDGKQEETYFIIVHSERLLKIRRELFRLFVSRGGNPKAWDPEHFYPHITLGYTLRDLHESDGIIKDRAHSLDERFELAVEAQ